MDLKNKVVVITGGSKGLGKIIAQLMIQEKSHVVINGRKKKILFASAKKIGATPFVADVSRWAETKKMAKFIVDRFKKIDIWINNAGIMQTPCPIQNSTGRIYFKMLSTNLFSVIYGTLAALPYLKKGGTIINIISTSALDGRPNTSAYCTSKWAARGFSESLQKSSKNLGINIISVYPGGMKTDLFGSHKPIEYDSYLDPKFVAEKIVNVLKKRTLKKQLIIKRR